MKDEVNSQESRMPGASQVPATAGDKCRPAGPPPSWYSFNKVHRLQIDKVFNIPFRGYDETYYVSG